MAILTIFVLFVFFPRPAHAYIDPASGSIIISAIISAVVAVSVAVRTYWSKLKRLFQGVPPQDEAEDVSQE